MSATGAPSIGSPPDFGQGGAWPVATSESVVISTVPFFVGVPRSDEAAYQATVKRMKFLGQAASFTSCFIFPLGILSSESISARFKDHAARVAQERVEAGLLEARELTYSQQWQRDGPVIRVPRGVERLHSYEVTSGMSESRVAELSQSMGVKAGGKALELSTQLSSKFQLGLTLTWQQTVKESITLRNDGPEDYRQFALWILHHTLTIRDLSLQHSSHRHGAQGRRPHVQGAVLAEATFVLQGSPELTFWPLAQL